MVAATYGNYEFKGFNKAMESIEKVAPVDARMEAIAEGTNIIALIKGRHVAITGRRPAGMRNRAEFEQFVNEHGGTFDNNTNHFTKNTIVFGDINSPSAKMHAAKEAGSIIFPVDAI